MAIRDLAVAALCLGACARPSPRNVASLDDVLHQLTAARPGWHLGTAADCHNEALAQVQREVPGYQPYRASGDFDKDGIEDAAAVLIRGDSGIIFFLRGGPTGFARPQPIDSLSWATNGGLFASHDTLGFGVFNSDVFRSWAWDPAARALRLVAWTPGSPRP